MSIKSISNFCINIVNHVSSGSIAQKSAALTVGLACLVSLPFIVSAGKETVASLYPSAKPRVISIHGSSTLYPSQLFPETTALTSQVINDYPSGQIRDTLVVWEKLASQIGTSVYFLDNRDISEQFSAWITRHENALNQINELDISNCSLTTLPPQMGQLNNLKELDLSDNQLTTLPSEISQLDQLKYLNLSRNQFKITPFVIGQLGDLQSLYLEGNQLTKISSEIGYLKHLELLEISWNQITEIPLSLATLPSSCFVSALGNQISEKNGENFQNQIHQVKLKNSSLGPKLVISYIKEILKPKVF